MNLPTLAHLGLRSEMIFHRAHGVVERHDGYWAIRTPGNPTYFWGNYLEFDRAPRAGDVPLWLDLFERHIAQPQPESRHIALSWLEQTAGERQAFVDIGCTTKEAVVMATTRLPDPPAPQGDVVLRPLAAPDWPTLVDLHVATREPEHTEADYRLFTERQVRDWRKLAACGQGGWWGAFAGVSLAAALGLFHEERPGSDGTRLARYQAVTTHPNWRRRGLCRALVCAAGRAALASGSANRLVMVADAHDVAHGIYASIGFEAVESWYGVQQVGY